ncbi:MAG TPA: hypothetical protein VII99_01095 [Bacteroidia bacterium]
MKKHFTLILFACAMHISYGQNIYKYAMDLTQVNNGRIKVNLQCPKISESSAVFVMPYVIPGSYAWKEYGRFLKNVKGYDANGKKIRIRNKKNIFYVKTNADKLVRMEYSVSDTWHDSNQKMFVFQPGGSNIEANKNFVLNHHAFEGYFEGYKNLPFEVEVTHPENMYGSSWLKKEKVDNKKDILKAGNYFELADNPAMYCVADTASFIIDSTCVHVASFSSNKLVKADSIKKWLKPLALSLRNFFGKLPVKDYYFIYYFSADDISKFHAKSGLSGFGALEHNHCSFYFLPELKNSTETRKMVQDVCAHEFLHILTPLNLHSKEIADFNFRDPKMSQHLWLYEGVTEYFSWIVRLQNNLVSEDDFFSEMKNKLKRAKKFGNFSFTEMSKNVLQPAYQEKYSDVYQKGALIAMSLDQLLLKKSNGSYGLVHLIKDLMKKYGSQHPFNDDDLFNDIIALTYPETADFINRYIKGSEDLPLTEYMPWFGYNYKIEQVMKCYFIGSFNCHINNDDQLVADKVFGSNVGLKDGDIILEVNGTEINGDNFPKIWENYFQYNTSPENVKLKVKSNGVVSVRNGKPIEGNVAKENIFEKQEKENDTNILRDAWLKGLYRPK